MPRSIPDDPPDNLYDRGFDRGLAIGEVRGQRKVVLRLLARRLGTLPESVKTRIDGAGSEELERWADRILDAASLDHVFAGWASVVGPELQRTMLTFDELLGKEAHARGVSQGERKVLLRQLALRFGTLPESVKARVDGADSEDLERWVERILDAASLDDVFAG
jgi:hypothetical protein